MKLTDEQRARIEKLALTVHHDAEGLSEATVWASDDIVDCMWDDLQRSMARLTATIGEMDNDD